LIIKVRLAKREDRDPLMSFVSKTWPWGDYIPEVWDRWFNDHTGRIFVAVADGKPVGMNHVRFLREGMAWLEGVRVRPDMRGKGVATMLARHALLYSRRMGMRWAGLISSEDNLRAHRQIRRMKMKKVCSFGLFEPDHYHRSERPFSRLRTARKEDLGIVKKLIMNSVEYRFSKGNFADDWTVRSFSLYGYTRLIDEERIHLLDSYPEGRQCILVTGRSDIDEVEISFASGDYRTLESGLKGYINNTSQSARAYAMVPETPGLVDTLKSCGLKRKNGFYFFRRRIPEQTDF
jgi:GNAT superfamily N-acetyltransferase